MDRRDADPEFRRDKRHVAQGADAITAALETFVANLLEIEPDSALRQKHLLELGADSIALAEVVRFVEDSFDVPLKLRQLFEELLTVEAIAAYVEERRNGDIRKSFDGATDAACATQPTAIQDRTTRLIIQFVGELLEATDTHISPDVALLELGADSIALAELVRFVDEKFGVPLKLRQLFEELLTVRAIANYIDSRETVRPAVALKQQQLGSHEPVGRADAFPVGVTIATPARLDRERLVETSRTPDDRAREIISRFAARTQGSRAAAERFALPLCNNRRSLSLVREDTAEVSYPIQAVSSRGAMLTDIDGNEYVDIAMGYGVHLFGHAPEFIQEAIRRQLERGVQLGPECDLTGEVAKGICELTGAERVLFCNSGTEAVMTALRIARCAAGRSKIATFRNAYHGHFDGTLVVPTGAKQFDAQPMARGTTAGMVSDNYVLTFDSHASLAFIEEHAHELAAVLVEPVQNRRPDLHAATFLQELRRITRKHGIILIFDEILVGFRIHVAGAQAWFGVDADIVAYAKVIGGGLPIGVVAGSREIMACVDGGLSFSPAIRPLERETIYTAGTYCKHPLAMAAALAVIGEFRRNGNSIQESLNRTSESFFRYLNDGIERIGAPIRVANFGSFFRFAERGNLSFVYQPRTMDLFNYSLMSRGVHVIEGGTCFLSTAHSSSDLEFVAEAVFDAARELREGGFWPEGDGTPRASALASGYIKAESTSRPTPATRQPLSRALDSTAALNIGVSFFGTFLGDDNAAAYDLILEVARRADVAGLKALWFPERHFHEFGGAFPNPSLIAAAAARETKSVALRAGSVVTALHHPVRIAEEWSVVDQLSGGRAGVAFASGWHRGDFVLARDGFADRRETMESTMQAVQALWRRETVAFQTADGQEVRLQSLPRTLQPNMPIWLASMGTPDTFRKAGELGVGILTNLVGQDLDALERNIRIYREALSLAARTNPAHGSVVVLLHTALAEDDVAIRTAARVPLKRYLASSIDLVSRIGQDQGDSPIARLSPEDRDFVFERGVARYIDSRALIGSPATCEALLHKLRAVGVSEIASLVDFGLDEASVLRSVDTLGVLQERIVAETRVDEGRKEAATIFGRSSAFPTDGRSITKGGTALATGGSVRVGTTYNQRMLWLASQFDGAGDAFHIRTSLRLEGSLHVEILRDVLNEIATRHGALRARFAGSDGEEMEVMAAPTQPFQIIDLSRLPQTARDEEIESWFREDSSHPFDLENDSLLRAVLLKVTKDDHILVLTAHHSIFDSVTEQIVLSELSRLYNAHITGRTEALPPSADFLTALEAASQRELQEEISEAYWRAIACAVKPLHLPFDQAPGALRTFEGARLRTAIGLADFQALRRCAAQLGTTPFALLLAIYMLALHEVCGQREITVGISRDMRTVDQRVSLAANFTNMIPISIDVEAGRSFREHVRKVNAVLLEAYEHAEFPFGRMLKFAEGKGWAQPPLVATCFNWDHRETPNIMGLTTSLRDDPAAYVRFPLSLNAVQSADGLAFEWDFNSHLFNKETIRAIAHRFEQHIFGVVRPSPAIASTSATMRSMPERIVAQCQQTPDAIALEDTREKLTYRELDRRSNIVSAFLASIGVKSGDIVGLALPSSTDAVIAMIGIWKAGAAFAALPPLTDGLWSYQTATQAIGIGLTLVDGAAERGPGRRTIDEALSFDSATPTARPPVSPLPDALAYLIFTSGSTGSPKATGIKHRNLAAYVDGLNERVRWDATGRFLFISPLHVDLGYSILFPALAAGGTVLVCPPELRLDVPALAQFVREPFDHLKITPTHLSLLLEHPQGQECLPRATLLCGGEALSWELVDSVWALRPDLVIFNHYGPAETTIGALAFRVPSGAAAVRAAATVPIGTPLAGVTAELRDVGEAAASDGGIAEILIGGATVGHGYLTWREGQPEWSPHGEVYATGDFVRRLESGEFVFHGRVDEQVKVRGYRVDLATVADVLRRAPGVSGAQVYLNREQQMICATVAARDPFLPVTEEQLLAHLSAQLAEEWLPSRIVIVRALPVGSSGKAATEPESTTRGLAGGETDAIGEVLDIWREVFGQNLSDADVNFFELGGHSIQAIKIIARIKRRSGVRVSIKDLFSSPTPRALANMIEDRKQRYQQGA